MHVCVKMMSKESKEALTVLIVIHVTQVERVKSGVYSFYTTLHTEYCYSFCYSCQKGRKCQILCTVLCIQGPSLPQEGQSISYLKSLLSCGFSGSPPVILRRQLC